VERVSRAVGAAAFLLISLYPLYQEDRRGGEEEPPAPPYVRSELAGVEVILPLFKHIETLEQDLERARRSQEGGYSDGDESQNNRS
jgi:hypothetical protein